MASEEDHPVYFDDDDDESDPDPDPLNDVVPADSSSSSDAVAAASAITVTVAIPASIAAPPSNAVTIALPDPVRHHITDHVVEKKPIDDSRRLFQRLWTDEDEIELLQGFLDYTAGRGTTSSGHHHDTAAFYDQIKNKLQLDFNRNQLVEKLRRLKKKYRTVMSKMSSGKEFIFKSPHDQATFEISRRIWSHISLNNHRGPVEFDVDDDQNNQTLTPSPMIPLPLPNSSSYIVSHINLNNAVTHDQKPTGFELMMGSAGKLSSKKRPRIGKLEDKFVRVDLGGNANANANANANSANVINNNNNNIGNNVHVGSTMQGLIEETVRNSLSPMFKELINNAVNAAGGGIGGLAMSAIPMNFPGLNLGSGGEVMNEKWRKQQILELEVYSRRLELVQDQIKSTLEELRSMGG